MVNRALDFFNKYGPVIKDGFKFIGGYTETITTGDGDFLTEDTLWDFKVSKKTATQRTYVATINLLFNGQAFSSIILRATYKNWHLQSKVEYGLY